MATVLTKLNCHNLTYYNGNTEEVMNYVRTEVSGGLDASVFTSIHLDHLEKCVEEHPLIDVTII